jgi:hypothetical protein
LILEKAYLETQDLKEFYNYAEANLLPYFNKIRFLYSSFPQDINYYIAIKTPETEANIILASGQIKATSFTRWLGSFNKAKYEKLGHLHNNDVDDYIEDYLLIQQFKNPVVQLRSSYRLYEVIGEKMTGKPIQKKVIDGKNYKYFEDSTGKVVLKIEQLAIAARHLVAHGSVAHRKTVEELNKEFGTFHLKHTFNSKDEEHMKLVKWSADRFLSIIENYLKNIIL